MPNTKAMVKMMSPFSPKILLIVFAINLIIQFSFPLFILYKNIVFFSNAPKTKPKFKKSGMFLYASKVDRPINTSIEIFSI